MQAGVVSVDREGKWPNLTLQGQGGSVVSVRVLVSFFARDPVLELFLGLAQVVEQARQLSVILPLEASSELSRLAGHPQERFNERLIRVGEDLSGVHGLVRWGRRFRVELNGVS